MADNSIKICLSSDDNYVQHMAVTIVSILENKAPDDRLEFCILDGGISEDNKLKIFELKKVADCDIEFVKVDNNLFKNCPIQNWTHLSLPTYYRLVIPDLKNKWDRVIYLDCDIVVRTSLKELNNLNMEDNYIAAAVDISSQKHSQRLGVTEYCNTGVLIIDTKKWRENNLTKKIFKWIQNNQKKIVLHDQDILNAFFDNQILKLDDKWNTQIVLEFDKETKQKWQKAKIFHYVHRKKPWRSYNGNEFCDEYIKYLKHTPFKTFLVKYYLQIMPVSIIKKILKFIFEIKNLKNTNKKIITILGFKFTKNRA